MQKNTTIIIAIATLVVGLGIGYGFGVNKAPAEIAQIPSGAHMMHDGSMMQNDGGMAGMMHDMNANLRGKTGSELDRAFIDDMIIHHEGAVEMAQLLLAGTERPELIQLGNDIITAQTGEIQMMQQWRAEWFGW